MKSKLSLKNLAKAGPLLKLIILSLLVISGCTSSTTPTYLTEDTPHAIHDICKNEYKTDVVVTLTGQTLWIYLPVEDMFVAADKPEKYVEKFSIEENNGAFADGLLKLDYKVMVIPEEKKLQQFKYNKTVQEEMRNVWRALQRVVFSMEREKKGEPKFFCLVTTDIKTGLEIIEEIYSLDLKKVAYGLISWEEYGHRTPTQTHESKEAIGDAQGEHLKYKDITMEEFVVDQIIHRIRLKFQKPEVGGDADIDKEILKIAISTLKIYGFKDFSGIDLYNVLTKNRTILNKAAVEASSID